MNPRIVLAILIVFTALAAVMALSLQARAHEAPSGWSYPHSCCHNQDCREVAPGFVEERPEGYVIVQTGEVIPMTHRKVRVSPDGKWHWCSTMGEPNGQTICLYAPFGGT